MVRAEQRALERVLGFGRHHGRADRGQRLGPGEQRVEMHVPAHQQAGDVMGGHGERLFRRGHLGLALADRSTVHMGDGGLEPRQTIRSFLDQPHPRHHFVARMGAADKPEALAAIKRAGARQLIAEERGDHGAHPHGRRHRLRPAVAVTVELGQMQRIVVPRGVGENIEVLGAAEPPLLRAHADFKGVIGRVGMLGDVQGRVPLVSEGPIPRRRPMSADWDGAPI